MKIAIITNVEGRKGLWRDGLILERTLLAAGHEPTVIHWRDDSVRPKWDGYFDAVLFCEVCEPWYYPLRRPGGLLIRKVNPEWEQPHKLVETERFDLILCKTRDAFRIGPWKAKAKIVGFESEDIGLSHRAFPPGPVQFLHPAGGSIARGTVAVLTAWGEVAGSLPRECRLHVVDPPGTRYVEQAIGSLPRVTIANRMPEEAFRALQRRCAVHVIPSEYEGFGHLFWEALSAGATVLGTDGPWWAEARGAYTAVASQAGHPRALATLRSVHVPALAAAMLAAAEAGPVYRPEARARFLAERDRFRARLPRVLERACAISTRRLAAATTSRTAAASTSPAVPS